MIAVGFPCKVFNPLLLQGGHYDITNGWWVTQDGVIVKPDTPEWVTYFGELEPSKLREMFTGGGGQFQIGGLHLEGLNPERLKLLTVRCTPQIFPTGGFKLSPLFKGRPLRHSKRVLGDGGWKRY